MVANSGRPPVPATGNSAAPTDRLLVKRIPRLTQVRRGTPTFTFEDVMQEQLPSWLTSLAVHSILIVVLGLIIFKGPFRSPPVLDLEIGGGSGQPGNGMLYDSMASVPSLGEPQSALLETQVPFLQSIPQEAVAEVHLHMPQLASNDHVLDIARRAISGGTEEGTGPGTGDGAGHGQGSGNDGDGKGYGDAPTRTQIFGIVEEARSFVYVFDHSESMNSTLSYSSEGKVVFSITPLEAAKAELLRSLEDLDRRQRFQIVFYNHSWDLFQPYQSSQRLVTATKQNKEFAAQFVVNTPGEGGTLHFHPLEVALNLKPDAIFLLTDGEAKDDLTRSDLSRIRAINRGRTKINVIHFCYVPRPNSTLVTLAEENHGQHLSFNLSRLGPGINGGNGWGQANGQQMQANPRIAP